ncbi:hypothetical protein [Corynebacterium sp. H113]|uniref:hypothetical protein n=1 Tax=Corynebacterium sp. H113 TaxID=3133419 RepID=UPI0030B74BC8
MMKARSKLIPFSLAGLISASLLIVGCAPSSSTPTSASTGITDPETWSIDLSSGNDQDNSRTFAPDGTPLPPGVLPPSENPAPGSARLGPDGHYDYSADDFVLSDPCDSPELMERLRALGYEEIETAIGRADLPWQRGCLIGREGNGIAVLNLQNRNRTDYTRDGYEIIESTGPSVSALQVPQQSAMADSCFSAVETEQGTLGFTVPFSDAKPIQLRSQACKKGLELLQELLQGDANVVG